MNFVRLSKRLYQQSRQYIHQQSWKQSKSTRVQKNIIDIKISLALLGIYSMHQLQKYKKYIMCNDEQLQQSDNVDIKEKIEGLKYLKEYDIGELGEFQEGNIKQVNIQLENSVYPVIAVKYQNQIYVLGGKCTYDGETNLADGIVFGNKLYCPLHGCAYNIQNGWAEYPPAYDNLPIFATRTKGDKVYTYLPKYPPKKVRPLLAYRDYNDLRKVLIIGTGAAAIACAETLRINGYTGELTLISKETTLPYDKTKLSKDIQNLDYDKILLRDEKFYEEYNIDFLLGREVIAVKNRRGAPYVELEDGLKIEYDALVIATGAGYENRRIQGDENKENIMFFRSIKDHQKLKREINKIKTLTIVGVNFWSLELAATIRKQFPHITVDMVDENNVLSIETKLGTKIADQIINEYIDNGVNFYFKLKIESLLGEGDKVNYIRFLNGTRLSTDLIIYSPNNRLANNEFIAESDAELDFDSSARLKVDYTQRSQNKRIMGAGDSTMGLYFVDNIAMPCENWNVAYNMGVISAYNILALNIPFHMVPFWTFKLNDKVIQYTGFAKYFDEVFIDGDLDKLDFIAYYSVDNEIVAACGTPSKSNDVVIMNEAIRLQILPKFSDIKSGKENISKILNVIKKSQRSGCFKDQIFEVKYQAKPDDVIWQPRDQWNEYENFWHNDTELLGRDTEGKAQI